MANVTGRLTINGVEYLEVDGNPSSGGGTAASAGSLATISDGSGVWIKNSATATDWTQLSAGLSGTGSANKIAYWSGAGTLTYDTDFHWDSSNNRLGISTTPSYDIHVSKAGGSSLTLEYAGTPGAADVPVATMYFRSTSGTGIDAGISGITTDASDNVGLFFTAGSASYAAGFIGTKTILARITSNIVGSSLLEDLTIGSIGNPSIALLRDDTTVVTGNPIGGLYFGSHEYLGGLIACEAAGNWSTGAIQNTRMLLAVQDGTATDRLASGHYLMQGDFTSGIIFNPGNVNTLDFSVETLNQSPFFKIDSGVDAAYFLGSKSGTIDSYADFVLQILNIASTTADHAVLRLGIGEASTDDTDRFLQCYSGVTTATDDTATIEFYIGGQGGTGTSLTVQHFVVYRSQADFMGDEIQPGMIVESTGERGINRGIETAIPVVQLATTNYSKKVFGVLSSDWDTHRNMSHWLYFDGVFNDYCRRSGLFVDGLYDPTNADKVSYSPISPYFKARSNSGGEGKIWVTNFNGEIQNGDYIVSSIIKGYGMKQNDDILYSFTVAKCTEDIDWDKITDTVEYNGTVYKKSLVFCTYHCG